MHPLAFVGRRSGANGMKNGDRIIDYTDGRHGVVDEFLPDGNALISYDDGEYSTVKWRRLRHETIRDYTS